MSICTIIPTYNNAATLQVVINDVLECCSDVIVVNDGSTDGTDDILKAQSKVQVVSYSKNKGKGYAIKSGFRYAIERGYTHAITIDSDGQHFGKDIPTFIKAIKEMNNTIFIGSRNLDGKDMSQGSSFANKFSNFWFAVETGLSLPDTQSGYRSYPLKSVGRKHFFSNKYEFEIEVLVRSYWSRIAVAPLPVSVYYPPREERVSHFRPSVDFVRISILNTILVMLSALLFWPKFLLLKILNIKPSRANK